MVRKPTVFIGSSTKGLPIARALGGALADYALATVWDSGVFKLSQTTIESLVSVLPEFDFAILVLTPDDTKTIRGESQQTPRDNVIFEIGLFMGAFGRNRTFLVCNRAHPVALPSDLWGVNLAMYDCVSADDLAASLVPAAEPIGRAIRARVDRYEVDFLKAYLSFIQPETPLSRTYSDMISHDYDRLRASVRQLEHREDWEALLKVKTRLGEYFEYSGKYAEGIEFGELYARATEQLGNVEETLWIRVKHVAYLQILADKNELGRRSIEEALLKFDTLASADSLSVGECKFYCHRYLGISWMRDSLVADKSEALHQAKKSFDAADRIVQSFPEESRKRKELRARLLGNYGNLALEQRQFESALSNYCLSLDMFRALDDTEHIGISQLKIAEAQIKSKRTDKDTEDLLHNAESIFVSLGWIEGQARVMEQRARLQHLRASNAKSPKDKTDYSKVAKQWALKSKLMFESIGLLKAAGRADELADEMDRLK